MHVLSFPPQSRRYKKLLFPAGGCFQIPCIYFYWRQKLRTDGRGFKGKDFLQKEKSEAGYRNNYLSLLLFVLVNSGSVPGFFPQVE